MKDLTMHELKALSRYWIKERDKANLCTDKGHADMVMANSRLRLINSEIKERIMGMPKVSDGGIGNYSQALKMHKKPNWIDRVSNRINSFLTRFLI